VSRDDISRRGFLSSIGAGLPVFATHLGSAQILAGAPDRTAAPDLATSPAATGLAKTPPMGWNSWNHFRRNISDALIRAQAEAMASTGMKALGYEYVLIDGGWEGHRDSEGFMHPNPNFPDIKALADYVHSLGLKLGIYSSPAPGPSGSFGHEAQDAQTYAEWGIDYLKYDLNGLEDTFNQMASRSLESAHQMMIAAYRKMGTALRQTGRPIVYSLCQYGMDAVWEWGPSVGANLWRTTSDIRDSYVNVSLNGFTQAGLAPFAGPGHWNDPDMLEIGNNRVNGGVARTQMGLWALLAAPLIAGNDLTQMSSETFSILGNREVIAVDQDQAGIQGDRLSTTGPLEIWMKPLADGSKAVGLFNRGRSLMKMTLRFSEIGLNGRVWLRDLWAHADLGVFEDHYSTLVPKEDAVMLRAFGS
jgi:alpha-galactosidase